MNHRSNQHFSSSNSCRNTGNQIEIKNLTLRIFQTNLSSFWRRAGAVWPDLRKFSWLNNRDLSLASDPNSLAKSLVTCETKFYLNPCQFSHSSAKILLNCHSSAKITIAQLNWQILAGTSKSLASREMLNHRSEPDLANAAASREKKYDYTIVHDFSRQGYAFSTKNADLLIFFRFGCKKNKNNTFQT